MRWLSATAGLLSLATLATGVLHFTERRVSVQPEPPFDVSPTSFIDLRLAEGEHSFVVRLQNPADKPRRILGVKSGCWPVCCTSADFSGKVTVPAGGAYELRCQVFVSRSGPIDAGIEVYLEDNGVRKVLVTFTGTAIGGNDAPPK